jgi:hypothetical protein
MLPGKGPIIPVPALSLAAPINKSLPKMLKVLLEIFILLVALAIPLTYKV